MDEVREHTWQLTVPAVDVSSVLPLRPHEADEPLRVALLSMSSFDEQHRLIDGWKAEVDQHGIAVPILVYYRPVVLPKSWAQLSRWLGPTVGLLVCIALGYAGKALRGCWRRMQYRQRAHAATHVAMQSIMPILGDEGRAGFSDPLGDYRLGDHVLRPLDGAEDAERIGIANDPPDWQYSVAVGWQQGMRTAYRGQAAAVSVLKNTLEAGQGYLASAVRRTDLKNIVRKVEVTARVSYRKGRAYIQDIHQKLYLHRLRMNSQARLHRAFSSNGQH
ncbi:hypothetical protein CYMTET_24101 [Cymbomonas tetramitiformis]|uniref:Uncharacterized protein n=1 Tax=Cymbomonas tetramitiformis TaxID=36881 RepID=A0AAE0L0K0_9CHLO|nr:hypothetical protein CYMTET_24101 [Cymbomonas tetramitiformis]